MIAFLTLGYSSGLKFSLKFSLLNSTCRALIIVRWRFCMTFSGSLCVLIYSRSLYLSRLILPGRWSGSPFAKATYHLFLMYYFY